MEIKKRNVINEYSKLIKTLNKVKSNIKYDLKNYEILEDFFISNLIENFKVLQFLLENNKNYGYYEIVRGNFEIAMLILFILEDKKTIEKKIAVYEYLRFLKLKNKLNESIVKSIAELLENSLEESPCKELVGQLEESVKKTLEKLDNGKLIELLEELFEESSKKEILEKTGKQSELFINILVDEIKKILEYKKINYPYNLKTIRQKFANIKYFNPNNMNMSNLIKGAYDKIKEHENNMKKYEEEYKKETILVKIVNEKYPSFYYYFGQKKLELKKNKKHEKLKPNTKYLIEEIEVNETSISKLKIKNDSEILTIDYNKNLRILLEIKSIKKLCEFLGKEKYYETLYEITSSIVHGEIPEFRNDLSLLDNTTFTNNILTCEIIKKLSLYFLNKQTQNEVEDELKIILGKNYRQIQEIQ